MKPMGGDPINEPTKRKEEEANQSNNVMSLLMPKLSFSLHPSSLVSNEGGEKRRKAVNIIIPMMTVRH